MLALAPTILLLLLALLLLAAAALDLKSRIIPNGLNIAIAMMAVPYWLAIDLPIWPDASIRIAVAAMVFMAFAACFYLGWMGGGDVKLIGAVALWLPPASVLQLLVIMALAGGVLTLVFVLKAKAQRSGTPEIPYGVAIVAAAMCLIAEPIFNQFA